MWEILFSVPLFKAIRIFLTVPRIGNFYLLTKEVAIVCNYQNKDANEDNKLLYFGHWSIALGVLENFIDT